MYIIKQDENPKNSPGRMQVKAENLQISKLCVFDSSFFIHTHIHTNIHTQGYIYIYIYIYIYM